jgi:fructose-bisphosphate aldolase class I
MANDAMYMQMKSKPGFIAALDQSGGSTPAALRGYGIPDGAYNGEDEMFALIHEMRVRIMRSPAFTGDKVIAAILFERTMDGQAQGQPVPSYLWDDRGVVPFLKVDKGLQPEAEGVSLMKPIPGLDQLLERAVGLGVFGTKMRSTINLPSKSGIAAIVAQQFELAERIAGHGLVPILVKVTIPDVPDLYAPLIAHERVLRVVALSGGYGLESASERLAHNHGMIASFSRALVEGLTRSMSDAEFDATLAKSIDTIYEASTVKA